jgi:hypothetical protein
VLADGSLALDSTISALHAVLVGRTWQARCRGRASRRATCSPCARLSTSAARP